MNIMDTSQTASHQTVNHLPILSHRTELMMWGSNMGGFILRKCASETNFMNNTPTHILVNS